MTSSQKTYFCLETAAKRGFTGLVFVKETPVGDAPLKIRECWVGLVLPCYPLLGFPDNGKRKKGVTIPQEEALQLLRMRYPWVARYWYSRGFPKAAPDDCFAFGENEIEPLSGIK